MNIIFINLTQKNLMMDRYYIVIYFLLHFNMIFYPNFYVIFTWNVFYLFICLLFNIFLVIIIIIIDVFFFFLKKFINCSYILL
jgi:hypothetical protein